MIRTLAANLARVAGLLVAMLCGGCERRAPGPEECLQFADAWMRTGRPERDRLRAADAFDDLVVRCLTEPFDRELVACVVSGAPRDRCRMAYARRRDDGAR